MSTDIMRATEVFSPARTPVLGVGISSVSLQSSVDIILDWLAKNEKHYVTVTGVHGIMEAQDSAKFRSILNESGLTVPDGMPLVWLSWLSGKFNVTRVYGPDLVLALSSALSKSGYSNFYYGGKPGVAEELSVKLQERFPGLKSAGYYCPPFRDLTVEEEVQFVQMINEKKPNVIWVGLSTPKQEQFMANIIGRLDCQVMLGVGAAFDFHTGRVRQAPRYIQVSGFEWLFRLAMEPRRLWRRYLKNNPRFLFLLACEKLGLKRF